MSNYVTENGLLKLKEQLAETKVKMKETSQKIKEAREMGDLSENAEYHEAKNEQSYLMTKQSDLEQKIKNAQIITKECKTDQINVGCTVEIQDAKGKTRYELVGSDEADPLAGRISVESPIGSALVGRKKGETIQVKTPAGVTSCKILSIA